MVDEQIVVYNDCFPQRLDAADKACQSWQLGSKNVLQRVANLYRSVVGYTAFAANGRLRSSLETP